MFTTETLKGIVRFFGAVLLFSTLLIGGLELLLSRYAPGVLPLVDSELLHHKWKPNSRFVHYEFASRDPRFPEPYTHEFNSQSWLETYEVSRDKGNRFRIFYLGDSFTEGTVGMEGSLPSLIERGLNERFCPTSACVEVINTGTSSYSPSIIYSLLRNVLSAFDADLFIYNFDLTDVFDDERYSKGFVFDDAGRIERVRSENSGGELVETQGGVAKRSFWTELYLFLAKNSHLYNLALSLKSERRAVKTSAASNELQRFDWPADPSGMKSLKARQRSFKLLRQIVELCRERGVPLLISSVPHSEQFNFSDRPKTWSLESHAQVRSAVEAAGGEYFDVVQGMKSELEAHERDYYYYPSDMHFNPLGYKLWAKQHLEFLEEHLSPLFRSSS